VWLRTILLSALPLSLVLGVGSTAVNPTTTQIDTTTVVVANAADAITVPGLLSYQGRLTDNNGNPVIDTTYLVAFRLYVVPSGGSPFWSETQDVQTNAGLFTVLLGSAASIDSFPRAGTCYLGMKVGADPEMAPRIRIASAAYTYLARCSDTANYAASAPMIRPVSPPISRSEIADSAIGSAKIAAGAVGTAALAAHSVTNCLSAASSATSTWNYSTSWQTILGMSVNITTAGGPVLLMYSGGGFSWWGSISYSGPRVGFGIFRSGALVATTTIDVIGQGNLIYAGSGAALSYLDSPPPGTYTYVVKLLWNQDIGELYQNHPFNQPALGMNSFVAVEIKR